MKKQFENIEHRTVKILMPVLHYAPVIGGLETWTENIAERLSGKVEVFLVTGRVSGQPSAEIKNGVNIFRTSLFSLKNFSYSSPLYIFSTLPFIFLKSFSLIKKEKIQLLHCQGLLSAILGWCLKRLTGIPYIVTVQSLEKKGFWEKLAYKNAAFCIAASSAVKEYFQSMGVENIAVIPNGIDINRFEGLNRQEARNKLGLNNEFAIMTVARLEKRKGLEFLIKALPELNFPFVCLLIGDGEERDNLKDLSKKLGVGDKVRFLGQIGNKEIPGYLVAADCFILPSLEEGFGIVILEAMAAGLPVIGSDIGGIKDIIEDGRTGLLVEPANPKALAGAIAKVYSGQKFIKPDLKKYDWDEIAGRVKEVYQKSLNL
jgi:glycosyltransferase involved in cell wall biosynthesis